MASVDRITIIPMTLTIKALKQMPPNTVFAHGVTDKKEHPWFNDAKLRSEGGSLEPDGRSTRVHWVAVRGGIHDWAIYHSMNANLCKHNYFDCNADECHLAWSVDVIAAHGAKLYDMKLIQELVDADKEAMKMYRL